MREPDKPARGTELLAWATQAWHFMRSLTPRAGAGIEVTRSTSGTIISFKGKSGGSGEKTPCPFGELTTWTEGDAEKKGILGGVILCGDKTFNIDNQELNLSAAGKWLVSIKVDCTSNMDNESEIILPGIKTGEAPTGDWHKQTWASGTNYPDNVEPEPPDGEGKIYLPIGILTIADGSASLAATGCGNFKVEQCGGVLSFSRV